MSNNPFPITCEQILFIHNLSDTFYVIIATFKIFCFQILRYRRKKYSCNIKKNQFSENLQLLFDFRDTVLIQSICTGYFNTVILFPSCHDVHFRLTFARDPALHAQSQSFRLARTCSFICLSNEGNCALWENICSVTWYIHRGILVKRQ